jgi:hypothetical protein
MNLEYIQLPDFLIADLYKSNLVIVNDEQKTEKTPISSEKTAVRQWYLGRMSLYSFYPPFLKPVN